MVTLARVEQCRRRQLHERSCLLCRVHRDPKVNSSSRPAALAISAGLLGEVAPRLTHG
jgi:hypothetical protein